MQFFKLLLYKLGQNVINSFWGYNIIWHAVAISFTYFIVVSGLDWTYYQSFANGTILSLMLPAAIVGFLFPILVPLYLLVKSKNNVKYKIAAAAAIQAASLGWIISSTYKAFTGRAHPEPFIQSIADITHNFNFGFYRSGIFWGWPSSHTTVSFALTSALLVLYPKINKTKIGLILTTLYIGIGVSVSIHWFSDFVAGAIIGSVVGITVGKRFKQLQQKIINTGI